MSENRKTNTKGKQVAVVIGATSKWQSDGRNTLLAHGKTVDDSELPVGVRWGVGGAVAQKFAQEGFFTVLTTRKEANASALAQAIREQGGECMIVELDLISKAAIFRPTKNCSNTSRWRCSTPRSTSPAAGPFSSPRKCCRRCERKAQGRFSSPTIPVRCAGRSA